LEGQLSAFSGQGNKMLMGGKIFYHEAQEGHEEIKEKKEREERVFTTESTGDTERKAEVAISEEKEREKRRGPEKRLAPYQAADSSSTLQPGNSKTAGWHFNALARSLALSTPSFVRPCSMAEMADWGMPVNSANPFWLKP